MSEQKARMPYFANNMVHHYEDDTEPKLHPHLFTQYIEKSAFDKAVEALRNTDCKCKPYRNIYGVIDTPPPCVRCKTLKDLGCGNG